MEEERQVTTTQTNPATGTQVTQTTSSVADPTGMSMVTRLVYFIVGLIETVLALRFALALLGANPVNWFANLIYSLSAPFVAPFQTLFNYTPTYGVSRLEIETLVAMIVFAILGGIVVRLVTLPSRAPTV